MTLRIVAVVVAGALLGLAPRTAPAQISGLPGGAAGVPGLGTPVGIAPGLAAAPGVAGAAAAAPRGLCANLKSCLANCKRKICASPYGTLLNNGLGPYSTLSGGLIPQFCPTVPTDADIAALAAQGGPNGAAAVAAKVKQDEAEAKARRAAVRYLGTVDCHYWPDAEAAIIAALRDDRNECVRYEAALALLNGCCCNARTIEALSIVVSGSEKDGKPSETSDRVQMTAFAALQNCLVRYTPPPVSPPEEPAPPESARAVGTLDPAFRRVAYYYQALAARPADQVVADARRTVDRAKARASSVPPPVVPGQRSVYQALTRAAAPPRPAPAPGRPGVGVGAEAAPDPMAPAPSTSPTPVLTLTPTPAAEPAPAEPPAVAPPQATPAPAERLAAAEAALPAIPPEAPPARAPAPAPARPKPARAPAANRSHRGLFGILRDSVDPPRGS